jgi:hypothetical protein
MSKLDQLKALGDAKRAARKNPVAKATKGKTGKAEVKGLVRGSTTGTGLRVGEAVAVQPATSEFMDVTAGETAPLVRRGRPRLEVVDKTLAAMKPWLTGNPRMSKSTWYRRKREAEKTK